AALVRVLDRGQRLAALCTNPEVVAAQRDSTGGWQLAIIRYGQLAAAGHARRGTPPLPVLDALHASAQTIRPGTGPLCGAPVDEARALYRWLTTKGTRLVRVTEPWREPARAAGSWQDWLHRAATSRDPYPAGE